MIKRKTIIECAVFMSCLVGCSVFLGNIERKQPVQMEKTRQQALIEQGYTQTQIDSIADVEFWDAIMAASIFASQ